MKTQNWLQKLSCILLMITTMLSIVQPGLVDSVAARAAASDDVVYDPVTGALAFVGSQPGAAKASSLAESLKAPAQNATSFAATYAKQLGINDVSTELALVRTTTQKDGRSTVRYQQQYQGIPVFAGEVIINTDAQGAMLSLTAKTSPNLNLNITPILAPRDAMITAVRAVATYHNVEKTRLTLGTATLQIYDSRLLKADDSAPHLVWNVTVSDLEDGINEIVLVDANNATIALHYNLDGRQDFGCRTRQLRPREIRQCSTSGAPGTKSSISSTAR